MCACSHVLTAGGVVSSPAGAAKTILGVVVVRPDRWARLRDRSTRVFSVPPCFRIQAPARVTASRFSSNASGIMQVGRPASSLFASGPHALCRGRLRPSPSGTKNHSYAKFSAGGLQKRAAVHETLSLAGVAPAVCCPRLPKPTHCEPPMN